MLVNALKREDRESMSELYNRYFPRVYQLCYSFTKNRDDAFDLAQDSLLKAFSRISTFEGASSFSTWLYAITRNGCINHLHRRKKVAMEDLHGKENMDPYDRCDEDYEERFEREQLELKLELSLQMIPDSDRQMLLLKYRRKFSVKELQREFNLSSSAVKMRLLRARQRAEQALMIHQVA